MYIYGKKVAEEALKNNEQIQKCYLCSNFNDQNVISAIQKKQICTVFKTKMELDKLVNGNHQGIILVVPDYKYSKLDDLIVKDESLLVMLDHIEDPHNLGAIIRTSEAAGVDGIIIPKDRGASINSTVSKVSAGALSSIKVSMVTNLSQTIDYLKEKGFWIIGTDMQGSPYYDLDYSGKICIIIGNEGSGLSHLVAKKCDFIASIPMKGTINSLNASVAAGIIIFEASKKRF